MIDPATLEDARALLERLREAGLTVATAESCTGGLVAASLTHHAGSSQAVLGGFVTYSNEMKHRLLDVDRALLDRVGAVSAEVAAAMAAGALARSGADIAVSITGIAGPGGATPGKPVGLVWLGLARRGRPVVTERSLLSGDRAAIRDASARRAIDLLRRAIDA